LENLVVEKLFRLADATEPENGVPGPSDCTFPLGNAAKKKRWRRLPAYWEWLSMGQRVELVERLIERVAFDGQEGQVSIVYRPEAIQALADELARPRKETS
jgi:hypothetical protein